MTTYPFGDLREIPYASVSCTYNTETREIREEVILAGRPSYNDLVCDGDTPDDLINRLVELKRQAADLGLPEMKIREEEFYSELNDATEKSFTLSASRTVTPGDVDYPEEFTPELDKIYVKRDWTEVELRGDEGSLCLDRRSAFNVADGLLAALALEKMSRDRRLPRADGSMTPYYADALDRLVLLDRERENLNLSPEADLKVFFIPAADERGPGKLVAVLSEDITPVRRFEIEVKRGLTDWPAISMCEEIGRTFDRLRYYS